MVHPSVIHINRRHSNVLRHPVGNPKRSGTVTYLPASYWYGGGISVTGSVKGTVIRHDVYIVRTAFVFLNINHCDNDGQPLKAAGYLADPFSYPAGYSVMHSYQCGFPFVCQKLTVHMCSAATPLLGRYQTKTVFRVPFPVI